MMKYLFLFIPFFFFMYVFFLLYQEGVQIRAEEKREEKIYIKEAHRKKGLQECLEKEEASIQLSKQSYCSVKGIIPKNCIVSQAEMSEILQRVDENKQICYLKFAQE